MTYSSNIKQNQDKIKKSTYPLKNPHTREFIMDIPDSTNDQMIEAIETSKKAFQEMKTLTSKERSEILEKTSHYIAKERDQLAKMITTESAKPIRFARGEVDRTVETLKFAALEAKKLEGESIRLDAAMNGKGRDAYTIYQPIGVIGAITPFNFPLNLVVHKVAPALGAGNTIIVKPAEQTPMSAIKLMEILEESGLPIGAFQVITGSGPRLGKVLIEHPSVSKITFTGSPEVGKAIKSQIDLKKITLELGNNSALYIDKSVQPKLKEIAHKSVIGAFSYNGQVCISTQRIYVHSEIKDEFLGYFKGITENLKYGDPNEEATDLSGMIDEKSQRRVLDWIQDAIIEGATLLTGGEKEDNSVKPTIIVDVPPSSKVSCKEVFGPVVIVNSVDSAEEALQAMNNSEFGLNAGIFTYKLPQAFKFAHEMEVGQVLINDIPTLRFDHMPYGGMKSSGYGYEGVKYAMKEMVHKKFISINYSF